ncbi:E3 ubiquitin-protein ligase UBR2-like [Acropora millepora]|uniref:E3 ubiquitin-protein ligase UBR2-like n=1 Tax=Acropora millepora TaxID=45264 RepID=UPI001CF3EB8D|nr:E3 ubiquitin-protein ligase UBR2-like [Acropora millepora]
MSQFETSESPKEVFGELGKRWIKQVKITKDFRSIFMRHLSDFASRCFEVYSAPNLKAAINEEKCQRFIFTALEYFLCGEDPIVGFQKLLNANSPSQLCGKVFKVGEPTYSCRDCGYDNTCVLCINCFQKSIHKNHHYKMNTSGGGGVCDCGDVEAWKEGEACEIHQQGQDVDMEEDPIDKLPLDIVERGVALYDAVLNYCIDLICWDKTDELPEYLDVPCIPDTFATVLFNDEVHTYEEVIRTLQLAIPDCTQNQALAFANTVDREGRSVVRTGSYSQCEQSRKTIKQGTSGPSRKPLKCRVMHHKVVAHQMCAVQMLGWLSKITNYSDGFRRILSNTVLAFKEGPDLLKRVLLADSSLWKVARAHTQKLFINTMLMDPVGKKAFAVHFTKNYCQLYKDFVDDDHEHSVSVTCLSVQLFTVPTLARMLILEHDVLEVIIFSFMDHLRPAISEKGTYEFQKQSLIKLKRAYFMLVDLKYILLHKPAEWTDELRGKFMKFLDKFFYLLNCMQGMDMTTRKIGRHIETEPDWEASFTLQFRVTPVISLVWDWCSSDLLVFKSAILKTIQTLHESRKKLPEENVTHFQELCGRSFKLFKYDVSSYPVSVHIPVTRFLSGLLLSSDKYKLSLRELFGFDTEDDGLQLFLLEYPLRTLVMVAQVQAGMWRRNGYAVINQVYNYLNVRGRSIMFDKDVVMLQVVASCLDSDYFIAALLDKFGLVEWSKPDFNDSRYDQEKLNQKMTIAESFMSMLIAVIGERYSPGIGCVSSNEFMRREIIHKLCLRPMTHSELVKALLSDSDQEDDECIDAIIDSVSTFKKPGVTGRGLYDLKPEFLKEYNPFFYHYTRIEQSKAEEHLRKRLRGDDAKAGGGPPPAPPEFCRPFSRVVNLLCCKTLVSLMNTLLRRNTAQPKAVTDLLIQQVLHLTCLALYEEKRRRVINGGDEFKFITAATATDEHPQSLVMSLQILHDGAETCKEHAALLDWIVKTLHEELTTHQEKHHEVCRTRPSLERIVSQEEEKAKKARMAQERRAKIMAQMSALQKAFIKENAELLASMETDDNNSAESHHMVTSANCSQQEPIVLGVQRCQQEVGTPRYVTEPCILCQESQEVNIDGRAVVMAAFVQRSTVMSHSRGKMFEDGDKLDPLYAPSDQYWGVHVSSCGHMMHSDCWQGFYKSVIAKERRTLRVVHYFSVDIARNEFLCPLCGCISNTVLPILPALFNAQGEGCTEDVTIAEFLSSVQDEVSSNLRLFCKDTKKGKKASATVSDSFQAVFRTLLKTGTKFSNDLKAMMRVFAQACFMVGLGVDPNEEDRRVPVLVWKACAYTIQSGESSARAEGKAVFSGLGSRQFQCMAALTRQAAVVSGLFSSNDVQQHCLRLLSVLTPDAVPGADGPSLLDLDLFSLLVMLRLVLPSMLYQESVDKRSKPALKNIIGLNSPVFMDQCVFRVTLVMRIVQILLTASSDLANEGSGDESMQQHDPPQQSEAFNLAALWGKLRHWAGTQSSSAHPMPQALLDHVKVQLLPFLRCSALFFHFLTEIPGPAVLKGPSSPSLTEELQSLCGYLSVPSDMTRLFQWNQDSGCISSSVISSTVKRWCSHEHTKRTLATAGVESLGYSIEANRLMKIPVDYSELINEASLFTCPNSDGDDSRAPALCLVCGAMLCSQSYCCQTEVEGGEKVGACAAHAQKCGAGVGVFLRVRECHILLMANKNKGCFYSPPYLDAYGETDQGLRRGNPLYLCQERYQKLEKLWLNHAVAEEVARCLESNRNLLSIDWTNL